MTSREERKDGEEALETEVEIVLVAEASAAKGMGQLTRTARLARVLREEVGLSVEVYVLGPIQTLSEFYWSKFLWFDEEEALWASLLTQEAPCFIIDVFPERLEGLPSFERLLENLHQRGRTLIGIDRMYSQRERMDRIVVPNFIGPVQDDPRVLYGWKYIMAERWTALSRGEWLGRSPLKRARRVVVLTGGSDAIGYGEWLGERLEGALPEDVAVRWVRGPYAAAPRAPRESTRRWEFQGPVSSIADCFEEGDVALTVFGTTVFELLANDVPVAILPAPGLIDEGEIDAVVGLGVAVKVACPEESLSPLVELLESETAQREQVTRRVELELGSGCRNTADVVRHALRGRVERIERERKLEGFDAVLTTMEAQSYLYQPTRFWREGLGLIEAGVRERGLIDFRRQVEPLRFFVPRYGVPGYLDEANSRQAAIDRLDQDNSLAQKYLVFIDEVLSGRESALADYRVFLASDSEKPPILCDFSESGVGDPAQQFEFDGRFYSRSSLNYLLGICFLKKHIKTDDIRVVLEIGGGFGTLGEILSSDRENDFLYLDIDLPMTGLIASYYLRNVLGEGSVLACFSDREEGRFEIDMLSKSYKAAVLSSWHIERLSGVVDLAVNFISFQEMEPDIVQNYCDHIDRLKTRYVLLRNLREGKRRVAKNNPIGVEEPILSEDYDRFLNNYTCCAVSTVPFGYRTPDNFHSELRLYQRISS